MIKKSYTSHLFEVNKNNIGDFELVKNHRWLRESQVGRILSALRQGKHFESQIVVNEKGSKLRIIDGGHRVESMRRFLKESPEKSIEVNMAIYKDLSEEEELLTFKIWNSGIKQSPDDYLNMRKKEIPIYKLIDSSFPCKVSIYSPKPTGTRFRNLIESYLGALKSVRIDTYTWRIDDFIDQAKDLGHNDHKFLVRFMNGFIGVFGLPGRTNIFSSYSVFYAIMRIYYDNCYEQGEEQFWNKIRSEVLSSSYLRQFGLAIKGREGIKVCADEILKLLNRGRRSNFFVIRRKKEEEKSEDFDGK